MSEQNENNDIQRELEQTKAIVRSIGDGVYVIDRDGLLLSINAAGEALLGWRFEELRGHSMHQTIHPRDEQGQPVPEDHCRLLGVLRTGQPVRVEHERFFRKDGSSLPVAYSSSPVLRDGKVDGAVVLFRDITDSMARDRARAAALEFQAQARREAEATERQYHALADFIPQQVWTATPHGSLDYVNQHSLDYFGRTFDEMIGWGWKNVIHDDDVPECLQRWTHSLATGAIYEVKFRLRRQDGEYRWHLGRAIAVRDHSGTIARWLGTNTDIDAEVRDHEREQILAQSLALLGSSLNYEETLDRVAAAVVPVFADGAFVHLVDDTGALALRSIHHRDPESRDLLRTMAVDYPPDDRDPFGPAQVMRTGEPEIVTEIDPAMQHAFARDEAHLHGIEKLNLRSYISVPLATRERRLGAITFVIARGRPPFDEQTLTVAKQIGERASLAIENALLYRRAEEASRAKDDFLATLSHELRTPLTAMLGWARMLKLTDLDAATINDAVNAIERSALAQAELIEDVLDISRVTAGKLSLNLEQIVLQEVSLAAVDTLRPSASLRDVHLELRCATEPISILADRARLQQIIWNLLSNAIKFTPKAGHVVIDCETSGSEAVLRIRDDGRGISGELLPYVFEAFRQEDGSTTRSSSGLGLGLAIVRRLVELHGGTIVAESDGPGRGSVFTVTLPAHATVTANPPRTTAGDSPEIRHNLPATLPDLHEIDVLIVDDNPDSMTFLTALMLRCGAVVRGANSVDEALLRIEERSPAVLISDIAMPGRDGYSLIREVNGREGNPIPSIALTAFGRPSDRDLVLSAGFARYFKKPVEPADLAHAVGELAGERT